MVTKKLSQSHKTEVRIAIVQIPGEITFESPLTAVQIREAVSAALSGGTPLILSDVRGKEIIISAEKIGFVEIGEQAERRVGFGSV